MEHNDKSRLDALNQKLYTPDESRLRKAREGGFTPKADTTPHQWEHAEPMDTFVPAIMKHPSLFKKVFMYSLVFFVVAIGVAAFSFLKGNNTISSANIDINIIGNAFTPGGEELPLQIEVANKNTVPLESADLIIEYAKGSDESSEADLVRIKEDLGTIDSGKTVTKTEKITLFGEQGSVKNIKARLEYRIRGQSAVFLKDATYAVTLSSAPLSLSVDAPENTSSNQDITLKIKVGLNTSQPSPQMVAKIEYPAGFKYTSSTPNPVFGTSVWSLASLTPGKPAEITVKGTLIGEDGEERSFHIFTGLTDPTDQSRITTPFNSLVQTIAIEKPFIEAKLAVNGSTDQEYIASASSPLRGTIFWSNNLPTRVNDLEIHARFSGTAWNESSVIPQNGFYNSINDEIIWDKNTVSQFASVDPGDSGQVNFNFASLPLVGGGASIIADPKIKIDISIKGKQPADGNMVKEVNNFESKIVKISSDLQLAVEGLYHAGPFTNTGPLPPSAEQKTTYTIHWTTTNSSNTIVSAVAKTTLPIWVEYTGSIGPSNETISYNSSTREVSWNIGEIKKTTGYTSNPREAYFQVALTPSLSQVGSTLPLTGDVTLSGLDQFTNQTISLSRGKVTTRLANDPGFGSNDGVVTH